MKTVTKFRRKNRLLVRDAVRILQEEQPVTLRQLYYRLISTGSLKNSVSEYRRLGQVMTRLREAGDIPYDWIVDHTRATIKPSSWSGLSDFGDAARDAYRKDLWASLPAHVEVFVEKDAVAGTIQPITSQFDVALRVCRGYSSVSFAGEIATLYHRIQKPIYAYYLGDFDPWGFDLERDLREKLKRYSGVPLICDSDHLDEDDDDDVMGEDIARLLRKKVAEVGSGIVWTRLAVIEDDFDEFDLIRLPVKQSDKRAKAFVKRHGESCAEVDAIPPTELRRRVEDAINSHIDQERWSKLKAIEAVEQQTLNDAFEGLGGEKVDLDQLSDSPGTENGSGNSGTQ